MFFNDCQKSNLKHDEVNKSHELIKNLSRDNK